MNPLTRKNLPVYILAAILTVATVFGIWYAYSIGGPAAIPRRSALNGFGRMLGGVAFVTLAAMYGRTVLKWIILKSGFLDVPELADLKSLTGQWLSVLNVTHPYLGLVAVSSTFLHCALMNSSRNNVFLSLVLAVVFLDGFTGLILIIPGIFSTIYKGELSSAFPVLDRNCSCFSYLHRSYTGEVLNVNAVWRSVCQKNRDTQSPS